MFKRELTLLSDTVRAKASTRVPMVLSSNEAKIIISYLKQPYHLMFSLLYGCGLRKAELLSLRIKDIDFEGNSIYVFRGKGAKDRMTLLPYILIEPLKLQISKVEGLHHKDLVEGEGKTSLPSGLARKYPSAITQLKLGKNLRLVFLFMAKFLLHSTNIVLTHTFTHYLEFDSFSDMTSMYTSFKYILGVCYGWYQYLAISNHCRYCGFIIWH
tara:strand:- start:8423 stop:9061 length:639 start_codon:yes stop_codon:yes gene_type:complete